MKQESEIVALKQKAPSLKKTSWASASHGLLIIKSKSLVKHKAVMKYSQIKAYQSKWSSLDLNDEKLHQLTSSEHDVCVVEKEV